MDININWILIEVAEIVLKRMAGVKITKIILKLTINNRLKG